MSIIAKSSASASTYSKATADGVFTHRISEGGDGYWMSDPARGFVVYEDATTLKGKLQLRVTEDYSVGLFRTGYESGATFDSAQSDPMAAGSLGGGSVPNQGSYRGGTEGTITATEIFLGPAIRCRYRIKDSATAPAAETIAQQSITIDLCPYTDDAIVPNSVLFNWMGHAYSDFNGSIYRDATGTDPGFLSGSIDYGSGQVTLTDWVVGAGAFQLVSLWRQRKVITTATLFFRTSAPCQLGSFSMTVLDAAGSELILSADLLGQFSGSHVEGTYDYENGIGQANFGDWVLDSSLSAAEKSEWWYNPADVVTDSGSPHYQKIWRPWPVQPDTARYNVVTYVWSPSTTAATGFDAALMPQDGRVEMLRKGDYCVVLNEDRLAIGTPAAGSTHLAGRPRLAYVGIEDAGGHLVPSGTLWQPHYDPAIPTDQIQAIDGVTFGDPLDLTGYTAPFVLVHRIEDIRLISDYDIAGNIILNRGLSHAFPANASYLATALVLGNRQAQITNIFVQAAWLNHWLDYPEGDPPLFGIDEAALSVTDAGAIEEDWLLQFTSPTVYRCIGRNLGQVAAGISIHEAFEPTPGLGRPAYFRIEAGSFGIGGTTGNCVRFRTVSAFSPAFAVMTVQPGEGTVAVDGCTLFARGNAA